MNILQIAEEEGALICKFDHSIEFEPQQLERFAARIRADQREKDAKICDAIASDAFGCVGDAIDCADAIRNSKE